jgi:hypothetical protein
MDYVPTPYDNPWIHVLKGLYDHEMLDVKMIKWLKWLRGFLAR